MFRDEGGMVRAATVGVPERVPNCLIHIHLPCLASYHVPRRVRVDGIDPLQALRSERNVARRLEKGRGPNDI